MEDNIMQNNDTGSPKFRTTGPITGRKFDAARYVTEFATGKPLDEVEAYDGRHGVRIGKQWTVVKFAEANRIVVWGKITDGASTFEILDNYLPPGHDRNKKERMTPRKWD